MKYIVSNNIRKKYNLHAVDTNIKYVAKFAIFIVCVHCSTRVMYKYTNRYFLSVREENVINKLQAKIADLMLVKITLNSYFVIGNYMLQLYQEHVEVFDKHNKSKAPTAKPTLYLC